MSAAGAQSALWDRDFADNIRNGLNLRKLSSSYDVLRQFMHLHRQGSRELVRSTANQHADSLDRTRFKDLGKEMTQRVPQARYLVQLCLQGRSRYLFIFHSKRP